MQMPGFLTMQVTSHLMSHFRQTVQPDTLQVTIFTCGTFETYEKQTGKKLHQMNPSYYDLKALLEVQECLNKVR